MCLNYIKLTTNKKDLNIYTKLLKKYYAYYISFYNICRHILTTTIN